ncbi:protein of unknown function [Streptomyces sp. KY75]|nr:protein of unknown function [Streptomyces sp. KY70]CAD5987510.1 protein of unknown function [Streptomyces sp. KY75]
MTASLFRFCRTRFAGERQVTQRALFAVRYGLPEFAPWRLGWVGRGRNLRAGCARRKGESRAYRAR